MHGMEQVKQRPPLCGSQRTVLDRDQRGRSTASSTAQVAVSHPLYRLQFLRLTTRMFDKSIAHRSTATDRLAPQVALRTRQKRQEFPRQRAMVFQEW